LSSKGRKNPRRGGARLKIGLQQGGKCHDRSLGSAANSKTKNLPGWGDWGVDKMGGRKKKSRKNKATWGKSYRCGKKKKGKNLFPDIKKNNTYGERGEGQEAQIDSRKTRTRGRGVGVSCGEKKVGHRRTGRRKRGWPKKMEK